MLLKKPGAVPEPDAKDAFDEACVAAMGLQSGTPVTESIRRKCVFLIPWGPMAIHFEFENGSNPFVKYGVAVELMPELYAWSKRWDIAPRPSSGDSVSLFKLKERDASQAGLFAAVP